MKNIILGFKDVEAAYNELDKAYSKNCPVNKTSPSTINDLLDIKAMVKKAFIKEEYDLDNAISLMNAAISHCFVENASENSFEKIKNMVNLQFDGEDYQFFLFYQYDEIENNIVYNLCSKNYIQYNTDLSFEDNIIHFIMKKYHYKYYNRGCNTVLENHDVPGLYFYLEIPNDFKKIADYINNLESKYDPELKTKEDMDKKKISETVCLESHKKFKKMLMEIKSVI